MPTYNYKCKSCEVKFSIFQRMNENKINNCPECDEGKVERLITGGTGMIFKGDGFYLTDYTDYGKEKNNEKNKLNSKDDKGKTE